MLLVSQADAAEGTENWISRTGRMVYPSHSAESARAANALFLQGQAYVAPSGPMALYQWELLEPQHRLEIDCLARARALTPPFSSEFN